MIPDEIAAYQANPAENPPKSIFDSKDLLKVLIEQTHQQLLDMGKQHGEAGIVLEQHWRASFTNNLKQAMNLIAPPAYWAQRANHTTANPAVFLRLMFQAHHLDSPTHLSRNSSFENIWMICVIGRRVGASLATKQRVKNTR